jgi:hypothetical protein
VVLVGIILVLVVFESIYTSIIGLGEAFWLLFRDRPARAEVRIRLLSKAAFHTYKSVCAHSALNYCACD